MIRMIRFVAILIACAATAAGQCSVPAVDVTLPPTTRADTGDSLLITSFFTTKDTKGSIALTNLEGVSSWTYCHNAEHTFMTRALPGGDLLVISNVDYKNYTVAEIDMSGNTLASLTEGEANAQLAKLGAQSIIDFNHEARQLPNGYIMAIAHNEQLSTTAQGGTPQNPVDIMGDEILVLDTNWRVVWTWNAFDFLPVSRAAVLGERCKACSQGNSSGCCPVTLATKANDWLHGNSLAYDSTDGNIIMSLRNQDWVIKIDYEDGAGNGQILWTLGNEATINPMTEINLPGIPSPWFSGQHDVEVWTNDSPKLLTLFDNGNTRHSTDKSATSRGQVLSLDEAAMTASLETNIVFPFYSSGYGTSQILDNGNYWWQAGAAAGKYSDYPTQGLEYVPAGFGGIEAYAIEFADSAYRSFRLDSSSGF